jgi:hypothetical protein
MRSARQTAEHGAGLGEVARLVERMAVEENRRIGAQHESVRVPDRHPLGFERGVVRHHHAWIGGGLLVLCDLRDHDLEGHAELGE